MSRVAFDFSGENFVVTGASAGIGKNIARKLLEAGASVLCLSRHMLETTAEFAAFGDHFMPVNLDVREEDKIESVLAAFVQKRGRIHGFVHAAGCMQMAPVRAWSSKRAQELMSVNVWAGMDILKLVSKKKYAAENVSHVFLSSVTACRGEMAMAEYAASKGALEAMIRSAAKELAGKGQRVNGIRFGWIEGTGMTKNADNIVNLPPLGSGRLADTEGMILFLLSEAASWMTGEMVAVDGGFLA